MYQVMLRSCWRQVRRLVLPGVTLAAVLSSTLSLPGPARGAPAGSDSVAASAASPVVAVASPSGGGGYWLATAAGSVSTEAGASYYGSTSGVALQRPVVGMAAMPDGRGYWLVASDGGVFSFGDARFFGSTGAVRLARPIVGMAATPDGRGYWLVASDGGVFSFGEARFHGSTGGVRLTMPMVGMAPTGDGGGYWLVASDGGVFSFGDARFRGSLADSGRTVDGVAARAGGYVLATSDGTATAFAAPAAAPPSSTSAPAPSPAAGSGNPLAGDRFFDPPGGPAAAAMQSDTNPTDDAALARIAGQPTAVWLGEWYSDMQGTVDRYETEAEAAGEVPVFVMYAIPYRDCGSYSSGGYTSDAAYQQFVDQVRAGIAGRRAVVIVEPDALPTSSCLTAAQLSDRLSLLSYASRTLASPSTAVYLDAGSWVAPASIAQLLVQAGVGSDAGFSVDVSAANDTASMEAYGAQVVSSLAADGFAGKHLVIDTSRNGNGMAGNPSGWWCNLRGLALGAAPTTLTGDPLVDALLWVKYPGESDGQCSGPGTYDPSAPPAGTFWPSYAIGLAEGSS